MGGLEHHRLMDYLRGAEVETKCLLWPKWHPIEGKFPRLKCLIIKGTNLKCCKVRNDHFSALEHLVIKYCLYLDEIPIEFADIYSL